MRLFSGKDILTFALIICGLGQGGASAQEASDDGFSAPWPLQGVPWIDPNNDYPSSAFMRGDQGAVGVMVSVGVNGKAYRCDVFASSGSSSLDATSCQVMLKRGTFTPAKDEAGQSIRGGYSHMVYWLNPNRWARAPINQVMANSVISVEPVQSTANAGTGSTSRRNAEGYIVLQLVVEKNGQVSGCKPHETAMADLACKQLMATGVPPLRDEAGQEVRAIMNWFVKLTTEEAPTLPQPGKSYSARRR